jgi:hypothetical protein
MAPQSLLSYPGFERVKIVLKCSIKYYSVVRDVNRFMNQQPRLMLSFCGVTSKSLELRVIQYI